MERNVAGQKVRVVAIDATTGLRKTGDAAHITVAVNKDYAGYSDLGDTSATEMDVTRSPGEYLFDLTQAETDAKTLLFAGRSSTSNIEIVPQTYVTTPPNFSLMSLDGSGFMTPIAAMRTGVRKNVARANVPIFLKDSTTHAPATGKTSIVVTRALDNGSFAAGTIGAVTEVSSGWYRCDFGAGDLNGDTVLVKGTCAGCDDCDYSVFTSP